MMAKDMAIEGFNKVKIFMKTGKFSYNKESFAKVHIKLFKDGMKTNTRGLERIAKNMNIKSGDKLSDEQQKEVVERMWIRSNQHNSGYYFKVVSGKIKKLTKVEEKMKKEYENLQGEEKLKSAKDSLESMEGSLESVKKKIEGL